MAARIKSKLKPCARGIAARRVINRQSNRRGVDRTTCRPHQCNRRMSSARRIRIIRKRDTGNCGWRCPRCSKSNLRRNLLRKVSARMGEPATRDRIYGVRRNDKGRESLRDPFIIRPARTWRLRKPARKDKHRYVYCPCTDTTLSVQLTAIVCPARLRM